MSLSLKESISKMHAEEQRVVLRTCILPIKIPRWAEVQTLDGDLALYGFVWRAALELQSALNS